jgi:hypothetical protein
VDTEAGASPWQSYAASRTMPRDHNEVAPRLFGHRNSIVTLRLGITRDRAVTVVSREPRWGTHLLPDKVGPTSRFVQDTHLIEHA